MACVQTVSISLLLRFPQLRGDYSIAKSSAVCKLTRARVRQGLALLLKRAAGWTLLPVISGESAPGRCRVWHANIVPAPLCGLTHQSSLPATAGCNWQVFASCPPSYLPSKVLLFIHLLRARARAAAAKSIWQFFIPSECWAWRWMWTRWKMEFAPLLCL